jgi:D-3-phosphoglycerate dehydrogenase
MKKVVLMGTFPQEGVELMRAACEGQYELLSISTPQELPLVKGASYAVLRGIPIGPAELDLLSPEMELYHRWGVGYDTVDVEEAGRRGIPVAITTGVNAHSVAELAILLMLAGYRRLFDLEKRARAGQSKKEDITDDSYLLSGKRLGLLGLGNIGSQVCTMARAFGAQVQYYDLYRASPQREEALGLAFCPLDELISTSDILSLHLPLSPQTHHMIGAETFRRMKPNALLVNTARGGIVDTDALVAALRQGELWGAALDTTEEEPLPADHPLFQMDRVIILPHAGGSSRDLNASMAACIMDNIRTVDGGNLPEKKYLANSRYFF